MVQKKGRRVILRRHKHTMCLYVAILGYFFLKSRTNLCCEQRTIGTKGFFSSIMLSSSIAVLKSSTAIVLYCDLSNLIVYFFFFFNVHTLCLIIPISFCVQPLDLLALTLSRRLTARMRTQLP